MAYYTQTTKDVSYKHTPHQGTPLYEWLPEPVAISPKLVFCFCAAPYTEVSTRQKAVVGGVPVVLCFCATPCTEVRPEQSAVRLHIDSKASRNTCRTSCGPRSSSSPTGPNGQPARNARSPMFKRQQPLRAPFVRPPLLYLTHLRGAPAMSALLLSYYYLTSSPRPYSHVSHYYLTPILLFSYYYLTTSLRPYYYVSCYYLTTI